MGDEIEKMCVYHIIKLKKVFENNSKILQANFNMLTNKDWLTIDKLSKKLLFGLRVAKRKLTKSKIDKVGEFVSGKDMKSIFEIFTFNESEIAKLSQEKLEKFRCEDTLIMLKDYDEEAYEELKNDPTLQMLSKNKSFMKIINLYMEYSSCADNTIISFNRELTQYQELICSSISNTYKWRDLLNEIKAYQCEHLEIDELLKRLTELRARRNIIEHNQSIINEKYVEMTHTYENQIGAILVTPPAYIIEKYKDLISYYILITDIYLRKGGSQINKKFLLDEIKRTQEDCNGLQYALNLIDSGE